MRVGYSTCTQNLYKNGKRVKEDASAPDVQTVRVYICFMKGSMCVHSRLFLNDGQVKSVRNDKFNPKEKTVGHGTVKTSFSCDDVCAFSVCLLSLFFVKVRRA